MTSTTKTYVILSEDELALRKGEIVLTTADAEELLEYQDVFLKFLDKTRFSYQIELSKGTYKGKEEFIYNAISAVDEIKEGLKSVEKAFKDRNKNKPQ